MSQRSASTANFYGVILAGGRGTRFWPQSRARRPKQLLPFVGKDSLLRQTMERLHPLIPPERIWVLTNETLRREVVRELPEVPRRQVVAEPVQRNTAPAIGLAACLLLEQDPGAVMGVFPSDHLISNPRPFHAALRRAAAAAQAQKLVVLGLQPQWAETGYGYIEFPPGTQAGGRRPEPVVRFREKPRRRMAQRFVDAGHFYWNSGMFVWQARTIDEAIKRFLPATAETLSRIRTAGSRRFSASLRQHYPACENISIDYAVLEQADNIVGFPCGNLGWNDLGSWEAVYQLLAKKENQNVIRSDTHLLSAEGNYVDVPDKVVALVGVRDLIVVETHDALLVCRRQDAQKVATLVKDLEASGRTELL